MSPQYHINRHMKIEEVTGALTIKRVNTSRIGDAADVAARSFGQFDPRLADPVHWYKQLKDCDVILVAAGDDGVLYGLYGLVKYDLPRAYRDGLDVSGDLAAAIGSGSGMEGLVMGVTPDARGQRAGTMLVDAGERHARAYGCSYMWGMASEMLGNLGFWKKQGRELVAVRGGANITAHLV